MRERFSVCSTRWSWDVPLVVGHRVISQTILIYACLFYTAIGSITQAGTPYIGFCFLPPAGAEFGRAGARPRQCGPRLHQRAARGSCGQRIAPAAVPHINHAIPTVCFWVRLLRALPQWGPRSQFRGRRLGSVRFRQPDVLPVPRSGPASGGE
jgi:hypothetical protein